MKDDEKDILAKLADAEGKIKSLEAEKAKWNETTEALKAEHASAIQAKDTEIATLKSTSEKLKTDLEASAKKVADLEAKDHNFEAQVAKRMAEHGVYQSNKQADSGAKPLSREEAITQYNKLTDPRERGEFFETHKQLFI